MAAGLKSGSGVAHYHLGLAHHAPRDEAAVGSIGGGLIIIAPDLARKLADEAARRWRRCSVTLTTKRTLRSEAD